MKTINDYFQCAMCKPTLPIHIPAERYVSSGDGLKAAFALTCCDSRIQRGAYRCTTCATLVALCEHLSELVVDAAPGDVLQWTPDMLLNLHPEIPENKRDRITLALSALQASVGVCLNR